MLLMTERSSSEARRLVSWGSSLAGLSRRPRGNRAAHACVPLGRSPRERVRCCSRPNVRGHTAAVNGGLVHAGVTRLRAGRVLPTPLDSSTLSSPITGVGTATGIGVREEADQPRSGACRSPRASTNSHWAAPSPAQPPAPLPGDPVGQYQHAVRPDAADAEPSKPRGSPRGEYTSRNGGSRLRRALAAIVQRRPVAL